MLKIRALNESSSSSEEEDEDNPKLSAEAQEAHAKILYEKAQRLTINKEFERAVETFAEVLQLPYLTESELDHKLSPVQLQLRLGCLKCLSTLYTHGSTKNLEDAAAVLELITEMEPKNVNFWYRLGKVALEMKDLELAFDAFKCALDCSPGHWGCIEHLVTVSFALHDLLGCLRFCAIGLSKDSGFLKGHAFKNQVFKQHSWAEEAVKGNKTEFESLLLEKEPPGYSDSCEHKYLAEVRELLADVSQKKSAQREQEQREANQPLRWPFTKKYFTLLELGKVVFEIYQQVKNSGTLLRPVDIFIAPTEVVPTFEETAPETQINTNVDGDCEELSCASVCLRSRSTSDDKESAPVPDNSENDSSRPANDNSQLSDTDDKIGEEDSQAVLQAEGSTEEENSQRKNKNKKDVKWWQIEGQRRSQRVRGNLVATPTQPKQESTFAEMMRSIIPEALLTDDSRSSKTENHCHRNFLGAKSASSPHHQSYFGSDEEVNDVKALLNQWECIDILRIITQFIRWISKNCRVQWSSDFRDIFLKLYQLYRNSVPLTFTIYDTIDNLNEDVEEDLFAALIQAELSVDSNVADATIFLLENATKYVTSNHELLLRLEWLKFRTRSQQCKNDLFDHTYTKLHLDLILNILNQKPDGYKCMLPTEHDSVISTAVVQEKLKFVQKIENLSKIEELYQAKQFEDLVQILHFSLSAANSPDDIHNRFYLTESYYHLDNIECVEQCEMLLKSVAKNGSEEQMIGVLKLLHNIYDGMKDKMTTTEFKRIINMLLKTLIEVEKEHYSDSYIITDSWCFLHKILYHMEQKESAFLADEESVPGSILILQLGHEILSKIGKCSVHNGHFLSYSVNAMLEMESSDFYWSFEETKNCLDQAILCLYGHPNKKFKLKNLKDHGKTGIALTWAACCQLYNYYKLEELPEFDSKPSKSISAEVENLFQRIISTEMPEELKPTERYHQMKEYVKGATEITEPLEFQSSKKLETYDIYYLLADFYLKNSNPDLSKAVEYYIWDLAVCPLRFDSWTSIALTKVEDIVSKINACDAYKIEEIMAESQAVIRCFQKSLDLELANNKVRIEFGSFLYSLHSVFSRELKFHASKINPDMAQEVESRYSTYLLQSQSLFEPYKIAVEGNRIEDLGDEDDAWINHYMLGKIAEKTCPTDPETFLSQYALASQLLHAKCSTYPSKINYYNPQENALEALEIYFRTHASVLSYIQKAKDYNKECEEMLLKFLKAAEESPFIKSKQGRGATTDGEPRKRKKADDTVSKKDMAAINSLVNVMLDKVEKMTSKSGSTCSLPSSASNSAAETSSSSDEDSNANLMPSASSGMKDLSLSSFRDRLQEEEASKVKVTTSSLKPKSQGINQSRRTLCPTIVEKNPYFKDFGSLPYGLVISMCLKAMKECVSRCPQYFKAFYRLAHAFVNFKNDYTKAKEYLLGNNTGKGGKVSGLYGERKPSNFFNGIWRHPIEDIDRPGSFAFYMSKSMQLLLNVLSELNDHKMLADVGIQLAKVPDSKNTYLYTEDREQYSSNAFKLCETAARKSIPKNPTPKVLLDCGMAIYDTYTKFQKFNPRENNVASVLLEVYKQQCYGMRQAMGSDPVLADAVRFFQHVLWGRTAAGIGNVTDLSYRSPTAAGSGVNLSNPTSTVNTSTNLEKSRKPIQRQPSDSLRVGQHNPYGNPPIPPIDFNFDPSAAATAELMIAAQLASYNISLQRQLNNYLNQQSALEEINSNLGLENNKPTESPPATTSSTDENVKKMQRNSTKSSNSFHSMPSIRDQIISNLANSMNRKGSIESSKSIKQAQRRFGSGASFSPMPTANRQSSPNQSTTGSVQQRKSMNGTGNNKMSVTPTSQHQFHSNRFESNTASSISSSLKDFPNISCTQVLPKLPAKPDKSPQQLSTNNNNTASQKPKAPHHPQNLTSSQYLSSSPFQVQSTAMTNPAVPGRYSPMSKSASEQNSHSNSPSPQPAHSQALTQPRYSANSNLPAHSQPNRRIYSRLTSSAPQPEVVDLTTKSPEKSTNQSSQSLSTNSGLNITRTFEKAGPNQQHYLDSSNTSVTLTKVSTTVNKQRTSARPTSSSSISSSHLMAWDINKSPHQGLNKSRPYATSLQTGNEQVTETMSRATPSKSMQISNPSTPSFSGGNNNLISPYKSPVAFNSSPAIVSITPIRQPQDITPKVASSQNRYPYVSQSTPATASRPQKRPMADQGHHYPLPPKKKHHIIPTNPLPAEQRHPDVEGTEEDDIVVSSYC